MQMQFVQDEGLEEKNFFSTLTDIFSIKFILQLFI